MVEVENEIYNLIQLKRAENNAQVIRIEAEAHASQKKLIAEGNARFIEVIAKARNYEAEQLEEYPISKDLARIRESGEAGKKIFGGQSKNYIFGENAAEILKNLAVSSKNK